MNNDREESSSEEDEGDDVINRDRVLQGINEGDIARLLRVHNMMMQVPGIREIIQRIRENDRRQWYLEGRGDDRYIQNMTYESWEELGRDVSNNNHVTKVDLDRGALNDHKMSFFFRGLTGSSYIKELWLSTNELSAAGIRSMVPFLQNAKNLTYLNLVGNNIQSEGFNALFRALQNSAVDSLDCSGCGIESVEIDNEHKPKHLLELTLSGNRINANGCRELAKLLQGGDSTLKRLDLDGNKIDDAGLAILVFVLRNNTSLKFLNLKKNAGISKHGKISLLKLVNDISSITATLQSNHTLQDLLLDVEEDIQRHIYMATEVINKAANERNPEAAGRAKVIATQLKLVKRAALAELQGVKHSLYSEIDPLHLPEVLSLVGRHHNQGELYDALKLSIAALISTVNRMQCLQQRIAYHKAKIAEHRASLEAAEIDLEATKVEFAAIEAEEVRDAVSIGSDSPHGNKRRRA